MDSTDSKKSAADPFPSAPIDPTIILQVDEVLARARKHFVDEDFPQALALLDALLKTDPYLDGAQELRNQIQQKAEARGRELFEEGLNSYMDYDWDRATNFWRKSLQIIPDDPVSLEWIAKAARRKEHEKMIRTELLKELEECGKLLSERNYVVAEERLDELKNRFTGGFRVADLQRIYEALIVRTRVELEKEFEDLRSNVVEPVHPKTFEKPHSVPNPTSKEAQFQREYMAAFEAGKKHFENGSWEKALEMWQRARQINPQDVNLKHWIGLAENHIVQGLPEAKPSPVRATIVFLSVFVLTALITYVGYQKYFEHIQERKNRVLVQRALEHYRAGRLQDSWRTLQIYVLHAPEDESARTLLKSITAELNASVAMQLEVARYLLEKNQKESAVLVLNRILSANPAQPEAKRLLAIVRGESTGD